INNSLGFYLVILAVLLVFAWLRNVLVFNMVGLFLSTPATIVGSLVGLAIVSLVLFVSASLIGKGQGSFWESTQIACRLSWIFLIPAFPLWVYLPSVVQALFTVAAYLLWAYLAIPSVAARFQISDGKHAVPLWIVAGLLSLLVLSVAITGTVLRKGAEYSSEYLGDEYERLQKDAMQQFEQSMKTVEEQQKLMIEEMQRQQAQRDAEAAAGGQSVSSAAEASEKATDK
ncbi:MAG: hypothetical protein KJT03_23945, partial [Verrucomicrobiae bacterium]|nr:hypothetical protein [Verrucomicrobiae bacterium]